MLDTDHTADRSDHYRRNALATRIARALVRPLGNDSVVIALDGPWGSGKSWLLDQVEKDLKKNPKITQDVLQPSQPQGSQKFSCHFLDRLKSLFTNSKLIDPLPASSHRVEDYSKNNTPALVVRFNPWQIGEESDLIQEFLIQIAMDLRPMTSTFTEGTKKSKAAGKKLIKYIRALSYGKYLKYIPVVSPVGQIIEDASNAASENLDMLDKLMDADKEAAPSLSEARESAKEAIKELGTRLIIMIDDIDRLRSREIRAVMQLVKSVLDFPNTSFLLAFDSEQVARALAEDGDQDRGMRYLEKIVQLSIDVPPMHGQLIIEDVKTRFDQALKQTGHTLQPYEEPLINDALLLVAGLCDTPRDVVRWANSFTWSLNIFQGSINRADLCVIEAVRLKTKGEFEKFVNILANTNNTSIFSNSSSEQSDVFIKQLTNNTARAFQFCFLETKTSNATEKGKSISERRLGSYVLLHQYIFTMTGTSVVNGSEIDGFLQNPKSFYEFIDKSSKDELKITIIFILGVDLPKEFNKIEPAISLANKVGSFQFEPHLPIQLIKKLFESRLPNTNELAMAAEITDIRLLMNLHQIIRGTLEKIDCEMRSPASLLNRTHTIWNDNHYSILKGTIENKINHEIFNSKPGNDPIYWIEALFFHGSPDHSNKKIDGIFESPEKLGILKRSFIESHKINDIHRQRRGITDFVYLSTTPEIVVEKLKRLNDVAINNLLDYYQLDKKTPSELKRETDEYIEKSLLPRWKTGDGSCQVGY